MERDGAVSWRLVERDHALSSRRWRHFVPDPLGPVEEAAQALFADALHGCGADGHARNGPVPIPAPTASGTLGAARALRARGAAARIAGDCARIGEAPLAARIAALEPQGPRGKAERKPGEAPRWDR